MTHRSRPVLVFAAAALVTAIAVAPASGAWRSISTMVYDDGGRICRNIAHFSMAHELPAVTVRIVDITAAPDLEVTPTKTLNLKFQPTPELFGPDPAFTSPYHFSGNFRVPMNPRPVAGHTVRLIFRDAQGTRSTVDEVVQGCTLGSTFGGFYSPVVNPPTVNPATAGAATKLKFSLFGNQGTNIFSEPPTFAPMPCSTSGVTPAFEPTAASGSLTYRSDLDRYIYTWNVPVGLNGCYAFWFRTFRDGLTHRALFDV